jgi:hypothetical protein
MTIITQLCFLPQAYKLNIFVLDLISDASHNYLLIQSWHWHQSQSPVTVV